MMDLLALADTLSILGVGGVAVAMVVLGLLSKRMSETTGGDPHYRWFFAAALLLIVSAAARLVGRAVGTGGDADVVWALLYDGLPALAVTIGVRTAWHYWSWMLAERD